jgi:hypothetical protein
MGKGRHIHGPKPPDSAWARGLSYPSSMYTDDPGSRPCPVFPAIRPSIDFMDRVRKANPLLRLMRTID